ncbi:MAG: LysR family transcriptional regulator [Alphaproteobacteria bacterium]|nr:LysR family transcriptional regulator [Alphaproteobacteria bacterium]
MALDPRAMRTFLAVCRAGSISEAARRIHLTQPAVSATILQLEDGLQTSLFTRARTGIQLTATGLALRTRAEALEAILEQAEREVALLKQDVLGPLVIGGTPGALASLVPPAVARVKLLYPAFELQIIERSDVQLNEALRTGRIDLAIVTTGIEPVAADMVEEGISRDPFALIVGRENDHLPERVKLAPLADAKWVLPHAGGAFRRQVDALFVAAEARSPTNVIRCDSLLTTKAIVRTTDYVTILPHEVADAELASGVLRAIEIEGVEFLRNVGLRMVKGKLHAPFAAAFIEALQDIAPHSGRSA